MANPKTRESFEVFLDAAELGPSQKVGILHHGENAAPPVTHLRELAYISQRIEEPGIERLPEYERWLATLIAPGTSLGGARPKASFADDHRGLWIAKFPARDDRYDVGGW